MGDKYKTFLDTPGSQYYFYSDAEKEKMLTQYKKDNYALNSTCFKAVDYLLTNKTM